MVAIKSYNEGGGIGKTEVDKWLKICRFHEGEIDYNKISEREKVRDGVVC
jgi:hypothetical protein